MEVLVQIHSLVVRQTVLSVKMQAKHSLVQNPFEDPIKNFGLPDAEILGPWPRAIT